MKYRITGTLRLGEESRPFSKVVEAETENSALEKAYTLFGSNNRLKRSKIKVESVEKVEK